MKSYNHLFEELVSKENIYLAMDKSSLGKRDRKDVQRIRKNRGIYNYRLRKQLENETYEIPHHNRVKINDGVTRKVRYIIKPFYKYEQIVHHAVVQVLKPIIMKGMYEYSCGSIPERGITKVKDYLDKCIKTKGSTMDYCFKMDIHHFFPSISHERLKILLANKIHDERFLRLCFKIIDAYTDSSKLVKLTEEMANMLNRAYKTAGIYKFYEAGQVVEFYYGLPLGYYTSQWFSNWYLQSLDHFIKEELGVEVYVRYMDDMVMFSNSSSSLHWVKDRIEEYLRENLDLNIKENWQVFRFDYINEEGFHEGRFLDFVGFKFYRDKVTLRGTLFLRARRKAAKIAKKIQNNWYEASQMISYIGWFLRCNTYSSYEKYILSNVNVRHLKNLISRHGRRISNVKNCLQTGNWNTDFQTA